MEVIAAITGPRGRADSGRGFGIDRFRESGFLNLCEPYQRTERAAEDESIRAARHRLEAARDTLVGSGLRVRCRTDGEAWRWALNGELVLPPEVTAYAWPVTIGEDQARALRPPLEWSLPVSRLTAFVAVRLSVEAKVDDRRRCERSEAIQK